MTAHVESTRASHSGLVKAGAATAMVAGAALLLKVTLIIATDNAIPEMIPTVLYIAGMVLPLFPAAGLAAYLGRHGGRGKKVGVYAAIMVGYALFIIMLSDALGALVEAVTDQKHLIDEVPIAVAGLAWLLAGLSVRERAGLGTSREGRPMKVSIRASEHAVRIAAALAVGVAALVLVGWWGGQARAAHNPGATVHVCAASNGALRLAEECNKSESSLVLATEAGLQAAESRIAALEAENADVAALEGRVAELEATVSDQTTTISGLEGDVAALESANTALQVSVGDLEDLLAGVTRSDVDGRDTLRFTEMNLQILDGTHGTHGTPNGLGNLIIGYNAPRFKPPPFLGSTNPATDRAGSHYLVVGDKHHWTRSGGILAGSENTASGDWASVTGGWRNTASGTYASVTGGAGNTASGSYASVAGGATGIVADIYDSRIGNTDFPDN